MLKSSLRHVARSPSTHPSPGRPTLSTPITASFSSRSHHRRHSSSKPPIPPNDGARNIPASSVKAVGTTRAKQAASEQSVSDQGSTTDVRSPKRKAARQRANNAHDGGNQWTKNMPSVPSTQHLSIDDVAVSSFFSLHRPMSVTSSIPQEAGSKSIEAMFAPKKQYSKQSSGAQDVIYTIASAVQSLEGTIAQQQRNSQPQQLESRRTDITTALTQHHEHDVDKPDSSHAQHLDAQPHQIHLRTPKGVQLMIQEVARHFRPYNAPPAPVPMSDADLDAHDAEATAAESAEEEQARDLAKQIENQDQEYSTRSRQRIILSLQEDSDLRSRKFFTHKAPAVRSRDPQTHGHPRQRVRLPEADVPSLVGRVRRGGYPAQKEREIRIHRPSFYAISVKRQRRLKMKKHKYKKLMRKTRNLRRRLDKL